MTRKEQILKLAQFDAQSIGKDLDHFCHDRNENELITADFVAKLINEITIKQHARLQPLLNAMAERIEQLEGANRANKRIWDFYLEFDTLIGVNSDADLMEDAIIRTRVATASCALDALLKGDK